MIFLIVFLYFSFDITLFFSKNIIKYIHIIVNILGVDTIISNLDNFADKDEIHFSKQINICNIGEINFAKLIDIREINEITNPKIRIIPNKKETNKLEIKNTKEILFVLIIRIGIIIIFAEIHTVIVVKTYSIILDILGNF